MAHFRILSVDGGGIRGLFAAKFLSEVEAGTGKHLVEFFDLITGTSTGGVIALALGLGVPTDSIARFYKELGPYLFREPWGLSMLGHLKHLLFAKHSSARLDKALRAVFGTKKLGQSSTRLVVPAFHVVEGHVHLLKTAHHERFNRDYTLSAVDVAMATTAAPTYFPAHLLATGDELSDGGVWANCPILVGVLEAIRYLGQRPDSISVLSVGTTNSVFMVPKPVRRWGGIFSWNRHLIRLLMAGQTSAALAQAGLLIDKNQILRVDEMVPSSRSRLDDWRNLDELQGRARYQARHLAGVISERFLGEPRAAFVPYYKVEDA